MRTRRVADGRTPVPPLSRARSQGDVYLGMYIGWYNVREETFVTETDAAANDYKDPVSGKDLKKMEEPSYSARPRLPTDRAAPRRVRASPTRGGAVTFAAPCSAAQCSSCLLYSSPSPRDATLSRMPSSA